MRRVPGEKRTEEGDSENKQKKNGVANEKEREGSDESVKRSRSLCKRRDSV